MAYFNYNQQKVYYKIIGEGAPMLLLHGNTVSSKLFTPLLKEYKQKYQLILIDFPGHGKSERLDKFELDFWYFNAHVCYALIQELGYEKVIAVGTSGGALVAINLALEFPEVVRFLVADSFEGEYPLPSFIRNLERDRNNDKKKLLAKLYWFYCHGFGWQKVVDLDTDVNLEFAKTDRSFFHKSISELTVPTLLTGSCQDEYCDHLDEIYAELIKKNPDLQVHMFPSGNHPAMLSNKHEFYSLIDQKIWESE